MSFANSQVTNAYRPDRRVLDSIAALATRVDALEAEKVILRAENSELRAGLEVLLEWAKTLTRTTTSESSGAPG